MSDGGLVGDHACGDVAVEGTTGVVDRSPEVLRGVVVAEEVRVWAGGPAAHGEARTVADEQTRRLVDGLADEDRSAVVAVQVRGGGAGRVGGAEDAHDHGDDTDGCDTQLGSLFHDVP